MFLVESAEKPDRPFRTGNLETLDWHWLGIPHSPNGPKKARKKKRFFLEWGRNAFVRHAAFSKHDAILQRIQPWPPKSPIPT